MLLKDLVEGSYGDHPIVVEVIALQEAAKVFQLFSLNFSRNLLKDILDILEVLLGIDCFCVCFTITEDSFKLSDEVTDEDLTEDVFVKGLDYRLESRRCVLVPVFHIAFRLDFLLFLGECKSTPWSSLRPIEVN